MSLLLSFAHEIPPPYYVVVFTSRRTEVDDGFSVLDAKLYEKAQTYPGFLGMNSFRVADGWGVALVYWKTLENIDAWRRDEQYRAAKEKGRTVWYSDFWVEICRVEQSYGKDPDHPENIIVR